MNRAAAAASACLNLALLSACVGDGGPAPSVVRDSAGIAIADNVRPDSAGISWWRVGGAALDLGGGEGEAEALFRVADAVRLPDGRVVVANGGTSEVRFYRMDGSLERKVGREGGGPGEFRRISGLMLLPGDSLGVSDGAAARVAVLDPQGSFVRDFGGPAEMRVNIVGPAGDGGWIGATTVGFGGTGEIRDGMMRPDAIHVRLTAEGAIVDTIGRFPGSERYMAVSQTGGQIGSINITTPPFARTTTTRVHGGELYVGTQDAAEVRVYLPDGRLKRIVRTAEALEPATPELVDIFLERRVAQLPEERRADTKAGLSALPAGAHVPPYGTFLIDRTGHLWVQDFPGLRDGERWSVFDPMGVLVARIALPDRFTPYDIGEDWVLGPELDALDIEHVRLYALERSR